MESYLKTYQVKLKTLAPIFIGSGKEIGKAEYVFDGKYVYVIDEKKLMDLIVKRNLVDKYMQSMSVKSFHLKTWLDTNRIHNYEDLALYTLSGVENLSDKRSLKGIAACLKNAYHKPYIPGSSLKGALRTVILWNEVFDNRDKLDRHRRQMKEALSVMPVSKMKNGFNRLNKSLEDKFFSAEVEETPMSIMRGLAVSDSAPLSLDDIILCEKLDVNVNGKEKMPNILRECIKPGKEIIFRISIDSSIFDWTKDDICDMIKNYTADYFDCVTSVFDAQAADEENVIYLGGGAGYFSKTVTYSLFEHDDAVSFTKQYLDKTTPPVHMHGKDKQISPHMEKCTRIGGKIYEMGKCRLSIEELPL